MSRRARKQARYILSRLDAYCCKYQVNSDKRQKEVKLEPFMLSREGNNGIIVINEYEVNLKDDNKTIKGANANEHHEKLQEIFIDKIRLQIKSNLIQYEQIVCSTY